MNATAAAATWTTNPQEMVNNLPIDSARDAINTNEANYPGYLAAYARHRAAGLNHNKAMGKANIEIANPQITEEPAHIFEEDTAPMATREDLLNRTAAHPTPTLVTSLQILEQRYTDDFANVSREELMVRSAIMQILETRYPTADAVIDAAVDACPDDKTFDYVAVLLAAIPETEKQ